MKNAIMDDKETLNRRARLRELIATCFNGTDREILDFIFARTGKRPNQGELSLLQKDGGKSFGDKKARTLTEQIGLHRRWFDFPVGTHLSKDDWLKPLDGFHGLVAQEPSPVYTVQRRSWPFELIDEKRYEKLSPPAKSWIQGGFLQLLAEAEAKFGDTNPEETERSA